MTEQDVREEILAPIIRRLGYEFGTKSYVERERHLVHPFTRVGHKSSKDVPAGKADYICGLDGRRGSFVVEAKCGNHKILESDIEQAHSYATHPEINAHFFVLSNGQKLQIFQTINGPKKTPIITIENENLVTNFHEIEALLHPEKLEQHSTINYDLSLPLIKKTQIQRVGIKYGWIKASSFKIPEELSAIYTQFGLLDQLTEGFEEVLEIRHPIVDGVIARGKNGRIVIDVEFDASNPLLAESMRTMGISSMKFQTDGQWLNNMEDAINVFETTASVEIPEGTELYSVLSNKMERMQIPTEMNMFYRVSGAITGNILSGQYTGLMNQSIPISGVGTKTFTFETSGDFTLNLLLK